MAGSPTQRSLAALRKAGWLCAIVEHWNPHVGIRQDLFGVADILAVKTGERPLLVQTTSAPNVAARVTKIRASPHLATLLAVFQVRVEGWAKPTKTIRTWRYRVVPITAEPMVDGAGGGLAWDDAWRPSEPPPAGKDLGAGPA